MPNPYEEDFKDKADVDVTNVAKLVQVHKHCFTCYKYGEECRFHFPRPVVELPKFSNGLFSLPRSLGSEWINNFNKIFSMTLRANHDIQHITNGMDSKSVAFYISDYITKVGLQSHNIFPIILTAMDSAKKYPLPNRTEISELEHLVRSLVIKCLNKLTTHKERSGPDVASSLLGFPEHLTDQTFQNVFLYDFLKWVKFNDVVKLQIEEEEKKTKMKER